MQASYYERPRCEHLRYIDMNDCDQCLLVQRKTARIAQIALARIDMKIHGYLGLKESDLVIIQKCVELLESLRIR